MYYKIKEWSSLLWFLLSLSIMLVNLVYTLSSNFTFESYFSGNMATDYTIGDAMYYNSMFSDKNKNVLTENLCNEIENMKGVNDFSKIYSTFWLFKR